MAIINQGLIAPMTLMAESKEKHKYYRREYIPQFSDGSGWDLEDKHAPCFYEHITPQEERKLKAASDKRLYKIVTIVPFVEHLHKDTYFVKGSYLDRFLQKFTGFAAYIVSIEPVESMPSIDEKLPS